MQTDKFNLRIKRFKPSADKPSFWQDFIVELNRGATVLDGLIHIKENVDPTLTFRRSCRSGICGSCAAVINGKTRLSCNSQISEVSDNGLLKIEPLRHFRVIKDLVVDLDAFIENLKRISPWLIRNPHQPKPDREYLVLPDNSFRKLTRVYTCILCAACNSDCDALEKNRSFVGPGAYTKAMRFLLDARDNQKEARIAQLIELGIMDCQDPESCKFECPKGIHPGKDVLYPLQKGDLNTDA